MTNEEINRLIEKETKGAIKDINTFKKVLKTAPTVKLRRLAKRLNHIFKTDRRNYLEKEASKLSFADRYQRIENDGKKYLKDKLTGELHSEKRMIKKQLKSQLQHESGRQLKKEVRFLRHQLKHNDTEEVRELAGDVQTMDSPSM